MKTLIRAAAPMLAALIVALGPTVGAQGTVYSLWVTLGDSDQLVEVDPVTFSVIRRIKVDRGVHGLAVSDDGSKIYVASDKTGMFQVVDARRGTVVWTAKAGGAVIRP